MDEEKTVSVEENTADIEWIEVVLSEDEKEPVICKPKEDVLPKAGEHHRKGDFFSFMFTVFAALTVALLVNFFIIYNAYIPSSSMYPLISEGDRLLGNRCSYLFSKPHAGDVVIINHKCYNGSETDKYIKRVIGCPGDVVSVVNGVVYVNDVKLEEDYLNEPMKGSFGPYEVPEDCYFVMGDNRNISDDSRFWDYPFVNEDEIVAKAFLKYYPKFTILK